MFNEGKATLTNYGALKTRYNSFKDGLSGYKLYKSHKDEINAYLFKSAYGSECDACLEFTSLLEQEHFDGVCKDCFKSGKVKCRNCKEEVYVTQIDVDGVCGNCKFNFDFDDYYVGGSSKCINIK